MKIIQKPTFSIKEKCTYLPDFEQQLKYFLATDLDEAELNKLLETGWRKFGMCYFRPECPDCRECVPIRIPVADFIPSKSQRRVLRKSSCIEVTAGPLEYKDEIYELYSIHSAGRFGRNTFLSDFYENFYFQTCPALQTEYYLNGRLIAAGFLDRSAEALSSVYFVFDTEYGRYRPGTYSILREIEYTAKLGLQYYYLGYYIKKNHSMAYKGSFFPQELYDWEKGEWNTVTR
ncbi:MAG: arginyltransferase [Spirochaetes bacterium]|nr:arginyltransferase [Spirochaetota bacterium]